MSLIKKKYSIFTVIIVYTYVSLLIGESAVSLPHPKNYNAVNLLLKKYTRPITILEIGLKSARYTFSIASQYHHATCIALLLGDEVSEVAQSVRVHNYHNITVLNPQKLTSEMVETLSRCEHFDVVLIQDMSSLIRKEYTKFLDAFLSLGDYIFIETSTKNTSFVAKLLDKKPNSSVVHVHSKLLFCDVQKTGLDIARWTQSHIARSSTPRYGIQSSFNKKFFCKDSLESPLPWISGINLVTFVMLKGIYPTDAIIRGKLSILPTIMPYHNDFVIGNIIIQGDTLIPIDINDKRRNANMQQCLQSALKLFNGDRSRFKDPKKRMDEYYHTV